MSEEIKACQSKTKYTQKGVIEAYLALKKKGKDVRHYKCDMCDGHHITSITDYKVLKLSEDQIMALCFEYANNTYKSLRFFGIFHIPNERKSTKNFRYKSKAIGIRSGLPDFQIILPDGKIFWVELKKEGGTQKKNQKKCEQWMKERGLEYYLINSVEDFKKLVDLKMSNYKNID